MSRYLENGWFRMALLLAALAAGALLTQLVPTYEEVAARRDQPAAPTSASRANDTESNPVSGVHAGRRSTRSAHRNT